MFPHSPQRGCGPISNGVVSYDRTFWKDGVEVGKCGFGLHVCNGNRRQLRIMSHFGDRCSEFSDDLRRLLIALWVDAVAYGKGELCACCGSRGGVKMEDARTMYNQEEGEPDPNADIPLCRPCTEEHHAHWDDTWAEYHAGMG